jgi:DNA-binding NtrC family response regulator
MKKIKILFADNDAEFLRTRKEILEAESYEVISASSPDEAAALLQDATVDLAIVDLRLRDDKDEADISGLALITSAAPNVPKILMTAYPTVEMTRRALKLDVANISAAVDMVAKQEGVEMLLRSISLVAEKHVLTKGRFKNTTQRLGALSFSLFVFSAIAAIISLVLSRPQGLIITGVGIILGVGLFFYIISMRET